MRWLTRTALHALLVEEGVALPVSIAVQTEVQTCKAASLKPKSSECINARAATAANTSSTGTKAEDTADTTCTSSRAVRAERQVAAASAKARRTVALPMTLALALALATCTLRGQAG